MIVSDCGKSAHSRTFPAFPAYPGLQPLPVRVMSGLSQKGVLPRRPEPG